MTREEFIGTMAARMYVALSEKYPNELERVSIEPGVDCVVFRSMLWFLKFSDVLNINECVADMTMESVNVPHTLIDAHVESTLLQIEEALKAKEAA